MTLRIMLVDAPFRHDELQGKRYDHNPTTGEPIRGETFNSNGETFTFTGTSQHEADGEYFHATRDSVDLWLWLMNLPGSTREALLADPYGPVPGRHIATVAHSGQSVAASYWPSVSDGTDGFFLPEIVQQWLEDHQPNRPTTQS